MIFIFFIAAAANETEILRSALWLLRWGAASQQPLQGYCEPLVPCAGTPHCEWSTEGSDSQRNQAVFLDPGQCW